MSTRTGTYGPGFPHGSFADPVNARIVESEILGGVYLDNLGAGAELELQTENRSYRFLYCGGGSAWIEGHPVFCPEPVLVRVHGSTWGGAMIKADFIGRGMHLEFLHPNRRTITTSRIVEIREVKSDQATGERWPNAGNF